MAIRPRTPPLPALLAAGLLLLLPAGGCSKPGQQDPSASSPANGQTQTSQPPPATPGSSGPGQVKAGPCAHLLAERCTVCHSTERICEQLGKKSKYRWQRTVELMISRGARVNPDEAHQLTECLANNPPELQTTCP